MPIHLQHIYSERMAEGVQHHRRSRQLQFNKNFTCDPNGEFRFLYQPKMIYTHVYKCKEIFFVVILKMWKCDNITHSMKIYSCTLCGWWWRRWWWCPGADREETHFEMAWRKLNVVSDNCHIHIYRHHMLLFNEESLFFRSRSLFLLTIACLLLVYVSHTGHLMYWIYFDRKKEEIMSTKTARNLIKTSKPNRTHNKNASMAHM